MSIFSISKYEDIERLWTTNQTETMSLEFKQEISGDNKEIAKDISAFANSEGGVIIYGITENQGRAILSNGIPITNNSERIQQIISSSTMPEVPMEIEIINAPVTTGGSPTHEFVVVKIPKSPFMIHQVTTTSKFYVRNNTTTRSHVYELLEMKENDISMRYENRFRSKQVQNSFIIQKEEKIIKELGPQWNSYILSSFVPHVRIPSSIKITKEFYKKSLFKNGSVIYEHFPTDSNVFASIPKVEGRMSDPSINDKEFFEIDDDRSVYFCYRISTQVSMMYHPMFYLGDLMHLIKRILVDTKSYGGVTFRLKVRGSIKTDEYVAMIPIPGGDRNVSDFEIQHEIPFPFEFEKEFKRIFEKYFEGLHIDNSLTLFNSTIDMIKSSWSANDVKVNTNYESLI
ncbi:MAG TPA: ATP-binding protein [Candidatus Nitrosotalea sp.]|nr:ATP-binding protein [Candidatus Nitrosotalea sp.]